MESKGIVEIKVYDKDSIDILGTVYYTEAYLIEMMRREYLRGVKAGETTHRIEAEPR